MKQGYGSRSDPPVSPWLSQRRWRAVGLGCLLCAAAMAWYGATHPWPGWIFGLIYWGLAAALLLASVYLALLDLRFIRLQYRLGEREIFMETLGSEEFRVELRRIMEEKPPIGGTSGDDANS